MKWVLFLCIVWQIAASRGQIFFEDYDDINSGSNGNNQNSGSTGNNQNSGSNGNNQNSGTPNTNNNNFASCYSNCIASVLKEYNPVCASNQVTYDNRRLLKCAQQCGLQIQEISHSTCASTASGK